MSLAEAPTATAAGAGVGVGVGAGAGATSSSTQMTSGRDSRFSCNICFEAVTEPVITLCGHLYCWPCLYRWLEPGMTRQEKEQMWGSQRAFMSTTSNGSRRCCPVCKASCSVVSVVPIFVRNAEETDEDDRNESITNPSNENVNNHNEDVSPSIEQDPESNTSVGTEEPETVSSSQDMLFSTTATTGLRRRISPQSHESPVPSRPQPQDGLHQLTQLQQQRQQPPSTQMSVVPTAPLVLSPTRTPLAHGLAISLQQALFGLETDRSSDATLASHIPPLHNRPQQQQQQQPQPQHHHQQQAYPSQRAMRNFGGSQHQPARNDQRQLNPSGFPSSRNVVEVEDLSTEFFSRLLLMLGSFVILCLLLF